MLKRIVFPVLALGILAAPAMAEGWHRFHAGLVVDLGPAEVGVWRGGYWHHGWHDGREGWWWIAGGGWYWYPTPVYPYPAAVSEVYVVQAPPAPTAAPPYYYYCDNPAGYYPYVSVCTQPWRAVAPQH